MEHRSNLLRSQKGMGSVLVAILITSTILLLEFASLSITSGLAQNTFSLLSAFHRSEVNKNVVVFTNNLIRNGVLQKDPHSLNWVATTNEVNPNWLISADNTIPNNGHIAFKFCDPNAPTFISPEGTPSNPSTCQEQLQAHLYFNQVISPTQEKLIALNSSRQISSALTALLTIPDGGSLGPNLIPGPSPNESPSTIPTQVAIAIETPTPTPGIPAITIPTEITQYCTNLNSVLASTPIPISTVDQLRTITDNHSYVLVNDIDFGGAVIWSGAIGMARGTPVRNLVFNGNGHTISRLIANDSSANGLNTYGAVGLLGNAHCSVVANLKLKDPSISSAFYAVGAVMGIADHSYIDNVRVTNPGLLVAHSVGGIVGETESSIIRNSETVGGYIRHGPLASPFLGGGGGAGGILGLSTGSTQLFRVASSVNVEDYSGVASLVGTFGGSLRIEQARAGGVLQTTLGNGTAGLVGSMAGGVSARIGGGGLPSADLQMIDIVASFTSEASPGDYTGLFYQSFIGGFIQVVNTQPPPTYVNTIVNATDFHLLIRNVYFAVNKNYPVLFGAANLMAAAKPMYEVQNFYTPGPVRNFVSNYTCYPESTTLSNLGSAAPCTASEKLPFSIPMKEGIIFLETNAIGQPSSYKNFDFTQTWKIDPATQAPDLQHAGALP